jgi:hypothetical protein
MVYDSQRHEIENTVMMPAGLKTKNYCTGEGQQKFTRPDPTLFVFPAPRANADRGILRTNFETE